MSLDFHLSLSRLDAQKTYPDLAIEESTHDQLFCRDGKRLVVPKLLHRLVDFYLDAAFDLSELPELLAELRALESEALPDRQRAVFKELTTLCEKALATQQNVYVFCD